MATREIPREEWVEFLNRYTVHHRWRLVNLEVLDPESGVGMEARSQPLDGIVAEFRHGQGTLEIAVGTERSDHLWHRIADPTRIYLQEGEKDTPETLEIESASGVRTLIHLKPLRLPAIAE